MFWNVIEVLTMRGAPLWYGLVGRVGLREAMAGPDPRPNWLDSLSAHRCPGP